MSKDTSAFKAKVWICLFRSCAFCLETIMYGVFSFVERQRTSILDKKCRYSVFCSYGVSLACIICLSACSTWSVGPDFTRPEVQDMPEQWHEVDAERTFVGSVPLNTWWQSFRDPSLISLVDRARQNSPTVEAALLKVVQYRAQYAIAIGNYFPQTQQLTGTYTSEQPSQRTASAPQPGEPSLPSNILSLNVGLQATWEIDIWGKYRRSAEAARASLLGAQAAYDLALVTLSADVAQQYITYRMVEQQIEIARRNNEAQKESVRITKAMFRLGATNERDYDQALAMQKSTEADIPQLQSQLIVARNALCLLLGLPPGPVAELTPGWKLQPVNFTPPPPGQTFESPALLPADIGKNKHKVKKSPRTSALLWSFVPEEISIGVPADLIRRRPDVRQAEMEAAAQCARIGVNKAQLFPAFSISGFLGFQGSNVGAYTLVDTFTPQGFAASAAPSVVLPFLNYGRLYNAVRAQDAVFQQSLSNYRQTVLTALQEAENAMASFLRSRQRMHLLQQAADAAGRSTKLALEQYSAGSTDFTTVVSAQTTQYQQENNVAAATGNTALQVVALYRALGGGWQSQPLPLPRATIESMKTRTHWGDMLQDLDGSAAGPELKK